VSDPTQSEIDLAARRLLGGEERRAEQNASDSEPDLPPGWGYASPQAWEQAWLIRPGRHNIPGAQDMARRSAWEARGASDSEPLPHCILDQVPRPGDWEGLRRTQRRPDARLRASGSTSSGGWLLWVSVVFFSVGVGCLVGLAVTLGWGR
jgi:hypothetical protein